MNSNNVCFSVVDCVGVSDALYPLSLLLPEPWLLGASPAPADAPVTHSPAPPMSAAGAGPSSSVVAAGLNVRKSSSRPSSPVVDPQVLRLIAELASMSGVLQSLDPQSYSFGVLSTAHRALQSQLSQVTATAGLPERKED